MISSIFSPLAQEKQYFPYGHTYSCPKFANEICTGPIVITLWNLNLLYLKSKLSSLDASKMNFPLRHLKKPFREETSSPRHPMGEEVFSGLIGIHLFRQLWGIQGKKFTLEAFMEGKADFLTSLLLLLFRICFWGIQGGKFNYEASREESSINHTRKTFFIWGIQGAKVGWREIQLDMRHPGRKVLLSIQGGHFLD